MKIKSYLFCKSFFLSFVIFGIIAGLILTSFYVKVNEVDPVNKESNIILGVVDNNKLVSMGVINFNPDNRTVTFLPIPDNTLLSKNNSILQDSYNPNNTKDLKNSVEDLIGAKINRYLFVSTDAIAILTNQMLAQENTQLLCQILYKFNYGGEEYSSYCTIDSGEVAKAMFMADSYEDLKSSSGTTVSFADIGIKFVQAFFTAYAKPSSAPKIANIFNSSDFKGYINTDLSKKEIIAYGELLAKYEHFSSTVITLSGKIHTTSSSSYFVPDNINSDKNIFK